MRQTNVGGKTGFEIEEEITVVCKARQTMMAWYEAFNVLTNSEFRIQNSDSSIFTFLSVVCCHSGYMARNLSLYSQKYLATYMSRKFLQIKPWLYSQTFLSI